jgi:hypothetical protein
MKVSTYQFTGLHLIPFKAQINWASHRMNSDLYELCMKADGLQLLYTEADGLQLLYTEAGGIQLLYTEADGLQLLYKLA